MPSERRLAKCALSWFVVALGIVIGFLALVRLGINWIPDTHDNTYWPKLYVGLMGMRISIAGPSGTQIVTTDQSGIYQVDNLPPGDYTVQLLIPESMVEDFFNERDTRRRCTWIARERWNAVLTCFGMRELKAISQTIPANPSRLG